MNTKTKWILGTESTANKPELFVMCWTEGDTIFLTDNAEKAATHKNEADAKSYLTRVQNHAQRFLCDRDESEIPKPAWPVLRVWCAELVWTFK